MALEAEPNGLLSSANSLTLGTAVVGQLANSADLDYFKFTVTGAGTLSLIFDVPTSSAFSDYFRLGLFDASGALLNLFATGQDKTFQVGAPAAGTYYVGIESWGSTYYDDGSYSLTVNYTPGSGAGFESEPNGVLAAADAINLGTAVIGQLAVNTDVDYFKFTVTGAGTLSLVFDVPTSSAFSDYFRLGLFDASGALLSLFATGQDKTFQVGAPTAGTYYVGIDASSATYYDDGPYSITVNYTPGSGAGFESEPNGVLAAADAINLGAAVIGQLAVNTDVDWFELNVPSAGELQIAFDAPTSTTIEYFRVWVYDVKGNLLAGRATGQDINFLAGAPSAGIYYVAVTVADIYSYNSGQYGLTVTSVSTSTHRESEVNDTNALADIVSLGSSVVGQLSTPQDIDTYSVLMPSGGTLMLRARSQIT